MELPREPTALPDARRYNRKFHAQQGKAFVQNDKITIQIPRINHTYLTKDVKLHFDFDLSYLEASSEDWKYISEDLINNTFPTDDTSTLLHITNYFNRKSLGGGQQTFPNDPVNVYKKPIPTFDINGPYGLISRIQVYDYLGTTLLEDIPSHDVLTAQFADVWFDQENIDINRPRLIVHGENDVRKQPCSNLFPPLYNRDDAPIALSTFEEIEDSNFRVAGYNIVPSPITVPTLHCELDLFSFLGRFSDKFVPLHNGFQIVLTLSNFTDAISFNTPFGDNKVYYRKHNQFVYLDAGSVASSLIIDENNDTLSFTTMLDVNSPFKYIKIPHNTYDQDQLATQLNNLLKPFIKVQKKVLGPINYFYFYSTADFTFLESSSTILTTIGLLNGNDYKSEKDNSFTSSHQLSSSITTAKISNVYLDTDLLEITPDLDQQVDKMVYAQGWKYQKDFFPYSDFATSSVHDGTRAPFIKRIIPDLKSITKVFVGQRPTTYPQALGRQKLGFRIRNYVDMAKLLFNKTEVCSIESVEEAYTKFKSCLGKGLDDYLTMQDFDTQEEDETGTNGNQVVITPPSFPSSYVSNMDFTDISPTGWWPGSPMLSTNLSTKNQGRFLLAFDTRIPGATSNSIAGIDTTKALLEYEIRSNSDVCHKVNIDVFVEHDSFIFVDPGKSTSVSF